MIRVGLVGAGPWVGLFTAPMLASAADLTPAAVLARRTAAAEELAGRHGAAAVGSFDDLLAACDAVARQSAPGEVRQPLDVHHGVHLQRLVAAVADSLGTGDRVPLSERSRHAARIERLAADRGSGAGGVVRPAGAGG